MTDCCHMKTISFRAFIREYKRVIMSVRENGEPIILILQNEPVCMISPLPKDAPLVPFGIPAEEPPREEKPF